MSVTFEIRRLDANEAMQAVPDLAAILIDCVEGGASIGFVAPLTDERATRFWQDVAREVAAGERILLVAVDTGNRIVGTVQLVNAKAENQPHRGDVVKMLVHSNARRQGIAEQLMQQLEVEARRVRRTVLVLDTVTGSPAERVYRRAGWTRVGDIPDYALFPDGTRCSTTFYYKKLD